MSGTLHGGNETPTCVVTEPFLEVPILVEKWAAAAEVVKVFILKLEVLKY